VLLSRLSVLQAAQRDAATLGAVCEVVLGVWSWLYVWSTYGGEQCIVLIKTILSLASTIQFLSISYALVPKKM
jgi:hypothetical protein